MVGATFCQMRDMETRLLEEREEKAGLMSEKQALQVRSAVWGGGIQSRNVKVSVSTQRGSS